MMLGSSPTPRCRGVRLATAMLLVVVLAGCGNAGFSGLYHAPLPGGADLGDDPYRITVQFADVLDLVPQATVKVNDVQVGRVERIELAADTKSAVVHLVVNGDVDLPANALAELRQTSLLGEKFVDLRAPSGQPAEGRLADGARIPVDRTNRYPELEEVFGALSLLLSGGGVEQLHTIAGELNAALDGNEAEIKTMLSRVDHLVTGLDDQKEEIVAALDGLDRLAETMVAEERHLSEALDHLAPGMRVVAEQRDELTDMLSALHELSDVTVRTVGNSRDQLVANLRALEPTLRKLGEAGGNLTEALKILPTYPLPYNAGETMVGDFANVDVEFDLNLDQLINNMVNTGTPMFEIPSAAPAPQQSAPEQGGQRPELPGLQLPELRLPTGESGSGWIGSMLGSPGLGGGR